MDLVPAVTPWLARQHLAVQKEIEVFCRDEPDDLEAFLSALAEKDSVLPRRGLVRPLYELWCCVPSRLAFQLAVRHLHTPTAIAQYLATAEQALLDGTDVAEFEGLWRLDDPLDEIQSWLRDRAHRSKLAADAAKYRPKVEA